MTTALSKLVKEMRESRGWSQEKLALETGMYQGDISRAEAGGYPPPRRFLVRVAEACGMEMTLVVTGKKFKHKVVLAEVK